jgi:hypothetical protein
MGYRLNSATHFCQRRSNSTAITMSPLSIYGQHTVEMLAGIPVMAASCEGLKWMFDIAECVMQMGLKTTLTMW